MSTEFFNDQWRIPSNENQNKVSNYSMDFNGSSDYIDAGSASYLNGLSQFSISVWFNLNTAANAKCIIADWNHNTSPFGHFALTTIDTSGTNYALILYIKKDLSDAGSNAVKTSAILAENTWNHVVCTYNSGTVTFYINGSPVSSTVINTIASNLFNQDGILTIGNYPGLSYYWDGKIDQVSIFDYELSQDQVTQLGAEGYAFNFNGSTQAIDCGTGSRFDIDQITVSGWVNLSSGLDDCQFIAGIRNTNNGQISYAIQQDCGVDANGRFRFVISQTDNTYKFIYANDRTVLNTWYHVVGVADGSDIKLYVNGVLQTDQTTYDGTITSPTQNFNIGRQPSQPLYYWDGELSNISVFNTGLTGPQVTTLYNSGKPLPDMSSFTSLQGWWKLDDTATFNSGTSVWSIPDDSSNSNTGTSIGMNASNLVASNINGELIANPMITNPKPIAYYQLGDQSVDNGANYLVPNNSLSDYVFNFDGTDDYVSCGDNDNLSFGDGVADSPFSISAWIKFDNTGSRHGIVSKFSATNNCEYSLFVESDNTLKVYLFDSFTSRLRGKASTVITTGVWNYVTFTYDGQGGSTAYNGMKIYLNGVDISSSNITLNTYTAMHNTSAPLNIGNYFGSHADGLIGEAAIFNSELSASDVTTIYNNGAPNDISSLSPVSWWKLNAADTFNSSTSTWTINDYGSGGNDGTSSGMDSSNLVVSDLQQTSGYSPYALDFDGINDYLDCGDSDDFSFGNGTTDSPFSISAWVNMDSNASFRIVNKYDAPNYEYQFDTGSSGELRFFVLDGTGYRGRTGSTLNTGQWYHVVATYNGVGGTNAQDGTKIYVNGANVVGSTSTLNPYTAMSNTNAPVYIGRIGTSYSNGKISNAAIFNTELSSTQVTELYNEGVPSNLNTFSGTAPVSWWQIGSNSSYLADPNPNPPSVIGRWTCLDEIGSNNAESSNNMTNDAITDGPGYSASGLGTSSIDIKGDAPYSTANGLSENMDVLDRTTDVPS